MTSIGSLHAYRKTGLSETSEVNSKNMKATDDLLNLTISALQKMHKDIDSESAEDTILDTELLKHLLEQDNLI